MAFSILVNRLRPVVFDMVEDIAQDLIGPLISIDVGDQLLAVEVEDGRGFFHVNFLATFDHFDVDIVETILFQRPALQAVVNLVFVRAFEMENTADVEAVAEDLGLVDIAGNAIEDEEVDVGLETASLDHAVNLVGPEADRNIVGDQLAFTGILQKGFAEIGANINSPKNIATGAMKKAGNGTENFTLGSFAGTRSAKK